MMTNIMKKQKDIIRKKIMKDLRSDWEEVKNDEMEEKILKNLKEK